jgi:GT2 family glycosyltransferase
VPDLSIVIPSYNTAQMTLRCCRAVMAAKPDADVIVVDDGSTDDTAQCMPPEVRVVRLETNSGFATAANRGVAVANGNIILLLNSDAIVDANALRAIERAFENDARLGVAGAQLIEEDGTPQWSGGPTPTLVWMIAVVSGAGSRRKPRVKTHVDWVSGAAMAFRREAWTPLNERFLFYCQDIDFCLAAREKGWDVRVIGDARVVHAMGKTIAADSPLRHDPAKLWPDLLAWGRARYGNAWATFARFALVIAAALRIAWTKLRGRDARAFVRGLKALRKSAAVRA